MRWKTEQLLLRQAGETGEEGGEEEGETRNELGGGLRWGRDARLADVELTKNRFPSVLNVQTKPGDEVTPARP